MGIPWKEIAVVAVVGLAASVVVRKIPVVSRPLVTGTLLYTVGYLAATKRPAGGYPLLSG